MENNNEAFRYTYSAAQQEEIKKIRQRYMSDDEDKMQKIRRLDKSVTEKGMIFALSIGVIGTLILGGGMSLCLVADKYLLGIILGVIGLISIGLAYPIYNFVTRQERKKIASEILRLTDELMK